MIYFDGCNKIYTDCELLSVTKDNCPVFCITNSNTNYAYVKELIEALDIATSDKLLSFGKDGKLSDRLLNSLASDISKENYMMRPVLSDSISRIGIGYIDENKETLTRSGCFSNSSSLTAMFDGALCSIEGKPFAGSNEATVVKVWKAMEENSAFVNKLKFVYTITHSKDENKYCDFKVKTFK